MLLDDTDTMMILQYYSRTWWCILQTTPLSTAVMQQPRRHISGAPNFYRASACNSMQSMIPLYQICPWNCGIVS